MNAPLDSILHRRDVKTLLKTHKETDKQRQVTFGGNDKQKDEIAIQVEKATKIKEDNNKDGHVK